MQALILLVQYFEGTQGSAQTWKLHGTAVNIGLQLGLQQPSQSHYGGPLEAEIRRRTWWACFMMDRSVVMSYTESPTLTVLQDVQYDVWETSPDLKQSHVLRVSFRCRPGAVAG